MSYIAIHIYGGDPADYIDEQETDTVGARVDECHFTDGEEMDAAKEIVGLLAERKHFDVRMWND